MFRIYRIARQNKWLFPLPWHHHGLSVVKGRYSFNCIPKFDLNFEFGGQTIETDKSVQEENDPVKEMKVYCS